MKGEKAEEIVVRPYAEAMQYLDLKLFEEQNMEVVAINDLTDSYEVENWKC